MDSPPEDMSSFYKGGYESIPETVLELRLSAQSEKYRADPILRHKKGGRLLEIGPWRGAFSCNMKDAGFEVTAIEMDSACVKFLREQVGIEAIQSANPVETMGNLKPGYDVIAAWHSLEHLPEPWLVIERAAKLLSPGGILLLAMPNPESYEFEVMKNAWMHLDAPRHLHFYPIQSLVNLCGSYGLKPLEITTADRCSHILSKDAWQAWVCSMVPIRYVRGALALTVGRLLYWLAAKRHMTDNRGSGYTTVFVRQ
jgi:SAM-dependent methyltransferase